MKQIFTISILLASVQMWGQCYPDRHNTSWNEGWLSCTPEVSPNPQRGIGHWIMYDFTNTYRLAEVHMWNLNDNKRLNHGFKDFVIDYSTDGSSWKELGYFSVDRATGTSIYEGETVADFGADTARFVLLTALNNWGGTCTGFSEIKINVVEVTSQLATQSNNECFSVAVYPNPHVESFNFAISTKCQGSIDYGLYDHTGRVVMRGKLADGIQSNMETIYTQSLAPGMYHLVVQQNGKVGRYPVIKFMR